MKKATLALSLMLLSTSAALAADLPVASRVADVTVYQDRALVVREGTVELDKGVNVLVFDGLPGALLEESLRGEGAGSVAVTMHAAELRKVFTPEAVNARVAALQADLEGLRDQRRAIELRQAAAGNQRAFLDSVRNFAAVQVPKEIQTRSTPPAEWTGMAQFLCDAYNANAALSLEAEQALRAKDREIDAKRRQLNELWGAGGNEKRTAVLTVESSEKGRFTARLSYVVPQAAWTLSYDAKVDAAKKTCTLISYGNVRQWTGEDWTGARLTLSSAKPAIGGRMPELSPWLLDFPRPPAAPAPGGMMLAKAMRQEASAETAMDSLSGNAAPVEAAQAVATVGQELGTVTYRLAREADVKSDNAVHRFPVASDTFQAAFDFEATPKLSPYAYLHAKVTNDKDRPLPGGEMNVFASNTFIGRSWLATTGKNEKFDLYLGIDEEVKVERVEVVEKRKKAMLGLRTRKDYAYKFKVENYKEEPAHVVLYDQLPVSRNAEIKAELVSASLEPAEKKDLGILKWELDVVAGGKKEFEFQFFVEYPADKPVPGVS